MKSKEEQILHTSFRSLGAFSTEMVRLVQDEVGVMKLPTTTDFGRSNPFLT
jgi:hypothetical protein